MMDLFKMEEFGDMWSPEELYDVSHFDDLEVSEAQDGLFEFGVQPKLRAGLQDQTLHGLLESPTEDHLGIDWMEQTTLMQYLEVPSLVDDVSIIAEPVSQLLDDISFSTPVLSVEEKTATELQYLLGRPSEVLSPASVQNESPLSSAPSSPGDSVTFQPLHQFGDDFNTSSMVFEKAMKLLQNSDTLSQTLIKVESPSSAPSSPEAQVAPQIDFKISFSVQDTPELEKVFVQSPLSSDDVESLLSSSSSPSSLFMEDGSLICDTSNLYEVVSNDQKNSRASPYTRPKSAQKSSRSKGRKRTASISSDPSELELELMSKKDRKKLQNKNAAIRYRIKKKDEYDQKRVDEENLESVNKSLHEKVEQLTREIKYMKDLISEVRKARGLS